MDSDRVDNALRLITDIIIENVSLAPSRITQLQNMFNEIDVPDEEEGAE